MTNNINLPVGIDTDSFRKKLKAELENNLTKNTINSLASLLAIDYSIRFSAANMLDHIEVCIARLRSHIKGKVVTDDSFSSSLALFAVAITIDKEKAEDTEYREKDQSIELNKKENEVSSTLVNLSPKELAKEEMHADFSLKNKSKSTIGAVIGAIVASCFPDSKESEKRILSEVLDACSEIHDISEILELVNSDPALFKGVADKALSENKKREEIAKFVISQISKIIHQQQKISQAKSNIRSWSSKLVLTACISVAAGVGFAVTGPVLPILLVPAIIATSRISSKITEVVHGEISSKANTIKHDQELLNHYKSATISSLAINNFGKSEQLTKPISIDLSKASGVAHKIPAQAQGKKNKERVR